MCTDWQQEALLLINNSSLQILQAGDTLELRDLVLSGEKKAYYSKCEEEQCKDQTSRVFIQSIDAKLYILCSTFKNFVLNSVNLINFTSREIYMNQSRIYSVKSQSNIISIKKAQVSILDSYFEQNNGTIIETQESKIIINGSIFQYNQGEKGICFKYTNCKMSIWNSSFIGNQAQTSGDVLQSKQSFSYFDQCIFIKNLAEKEGGVLYQYESNIYQIRNCSFNENQADDYSNKKFE